MSGWIEDTHGQIKLPTPGGGYGVGGGRAGVSLDAGVVGQAHGPGEISGLGLGLGPVARAFENWAGVMAQQEERAQKAEALRESCLFQDEEREMLARMREMKSRDGYEKSVEFAGEFYDTRGEKLLKTARGEFQKNFLESFLGYRRAAGLDQAFAHRARELEVFEREVWAGSQANTLAVIGHDPENWRDHVKGLNSLWDALYPGEHPEMKRARHRAAEEAGLEAAFAALADTDRAAACRLLEDPDGPRPSLKARMLEHLQLLDARALEHFNI